MFLCIMCLLSFLLGVLGENLRDDIVLKHWMRKFRETPEYAKMGADLDEWRAWRKAKEAGDAQTEDQNPA